MEFSHNILSYRANNKEILHNLHINGYVARFIRVHMQIKQIFHI